MRTAGTAGHLSLIDDNSAGGLTFGGETHILHPLQYAVVKLSICIDLALKDGVLDRRIVDLQRSGSLLVDRLLEIRLFRSRCVKRRDHALRILLLKLVEARL